MRKQEIIEARPDWFDLQTNSIPVQSTDTFRPKHREDRIIPMTKASKAFLKTYGFRSPFMLRPEVLHWKSRYRWDFRRPWTEYVAKQKCPWVTPQM